LTGGPSAFLPPGRYRVDFTLAVADTVAAPVATLRVTADANPTPVRTRELSGTDFPAAGRVTPHTLTLDVEEEPDLVEFRVESTGSTAVSVDCIDLTRLPDPVLDLPGYKNDLWKLFSSGTSEPAGMDARCKE